MFGTARKITERAGYVPAVFGVFAVGGYQGLQTETVTLDLPGLFVRIITIEAIPTTIVFSMLVTISGVMLAREVYGERGSDERVTDGPKIAAGSGEGSRRLGSPPASFSLRSFRRSCCSCCSISTLSSCCRSRRSSSLSARSRIMIAGRTTLSNSHERWRSYRPSTRGLGC